MTSSKQGGQAGVGMWRLGVFICVLGAGALQVSQDPGEVTVTVGDEVALGCQVLVSKPWDLLRLEWVREVGHRVLCATRLRPTTPTPPEPCALHTPHLHLAWHPPRAILSLGRVQRDDAGRYLCRVTLEIPHHGTATGNGTLLNVTTATAAKGGQQSGLVRRLAGALGGTGLLLGLALLAHWRWRRNSDTIIYENMMPPSVQTPKKLPLSHVVTQNSVYLEELPWAQGPPTAPRP